MIVFGAAVIIAAAFFVSKLQSVRSAPNVTVENTYYNIEGQTGRALKDQMRLLGPKSRWARTKWHVRWSSSCNVTVAITYIYPRLINRHTVSAGVLQKWDDMMIALVRHEEGHTAITVKAATEIEAADCDNASDIFKNGNRLNKRYDLETDHGRNQGVTLMD